MLLEYDAQGDRYGEKSHMEQAIAEFRDIKKRDEDTGKRYADFVPDDSWHLGKFKELQEQASALPGSDVRRGLILASVAADQGVEAATRKSMELTSGEQERSKSMSTAGWLSLNLRKYPEAAEMISIASKSQGNSAQITAFFNAIKNTKPYEQIKISSSDPRSAVQGLLISALGRNANYETTLAFMSKSALKSQNPAEDKDKYRQIAFQIKGQAAKSGLTPASLADIAISNARYSVEGDDALGYKITMEPFGGAAQHIYIIREDGQYKCLHYSASASDVPEEIGWEVLARLGKNDLPGARKWLDWARELVHISDNDDPLAGQPFPHFWTKDQEGDANAIRTAAFVLLPSKLLQGEYLSSLIQQREAAKIDADRTRLTLVLAHAYAAQERWSDLLPVSGELIKAAPIRLQLSILP